jgi:sensor histidine kinase YesM
MLFRDGVPPRWLIGLLYFGFWTILGLVNAASEIIDRARFDPDTAAWEPLLWELSSVYTVGMLYPAVAYVVQRTASMRRWAPWAALHFLLIVPFSLLHTVGMASIRTVVYRLADTPYSFGGGDLFQQVMYEFYKDISLYWVLVAVALAFDYYRKYRDRELQLAQAKLQNLRAQLHPHFLFNTLNMISSRMYDDPAEADRMIVRLSDLLRFSLKTSDEPEVPLRSELEMLELYLDIMRARFQDSVQVRLRVDPEARNAAVPAMLLQPIVENAFRHGVANRASGGVVEVAGVLHNGRIRITVCDNGPGIKGDASHALAKGFGLSITVERLRQLYGGEHRLELRNRSPEEGGGLEVTIELPSRIGG